MITNIIHTYILIRAESAGIHFESISETIGDPLVGGSQVCGNLMPWSVHTLKIRVPSFR